LLETLAIGCANFGQEVNVAPSAHAPVQIARQHGQFLFFGHVPFVQIGTLVGFEPLAILSFHE
jgi:hypothetical protein